MTSKHIGIPEDVIIYPELSDKSDEFYLGSRVDLENASPRGFLPFMSLTAPPSHASPIEGNAWDRGEICAWIKRA